MAEKQELAPVSESVSVKNTREHISYVWARPFVNAESPIVSTMFPDKSFNKLSWKMIWKPENPQYLDTCTLFLHLVSAPHGIVWTRYSLVIKSSRAELFSIKDIVAAFDNSIVPRRSNLEHLCVPRLGYILQNLHSMTNTLHIRIDMWAVVTEPKPQHNIKPICQHDCKLGEDIGPTFDDATFSDVLINVGKGEFKAHRHILAARSPVFAAMLKHDTLERQSGCISIVDIEADTIQMLLLFIYKGHVDIPTVDVASELLRAASLYAVDDLKKLCVNFLITKLDQQNVLDALLLGELHNAPDLKQNATDYFLTHPKHYDLSQFENVEKCRPNLLSELLLKMALKDCNNCVLQDLVK